MIKLALRHPHSSGKHLLSAKDSVLHQGNLNEVDCLQLWLPALNESAISQRCATTGSEFERNSIRLCRDRQKVVPNPVAQCANPLHGAFWETGLRLQSQ